MKLIRKIPIVRELIVRINLDDKDCVLATFPKSGTTWFRFIWANCISLIELNGERVDYSFINEKIVANIDTPKFSKLKYTSLPRLVSTHKPYKERIFKNNRIIHLYRNPGDTLVSYYEYLRAKKKSPWQSDFHEFIRHNIYGLPAWCKHFIEWKERATTSISYEELKSEPITTIKRMFSDLGIHSIPEYIIELAVDRSDFRYIQEIEKKYGLDKDHRGEFKEGFLFARKGEVGQWKEYFDEHDVQYAISILKKFGIDQSHFR